MLIKAIDVNVGDLVMFGDFEAEIADVMVAEEDSVVLRFEQETQYISKWFNKNAIVLRKDK